jgi:hypothetical protein
MKKIIKESGLRDIKALAKRYPKAKIYFHQDLDGVTTAIAMKKYLEDNGIDVVDSEVIQYGEKEFAVKKPDASGDVMPVLVDFAHGKPMFVIHTDHHDTQVGAEKDASKSFRQARSNVETISQIISPKELFPSSDILLISTVDSADFAKHDITTKEVVNFLFRLDKEKGLAKNKMLLGLVTNKLLLAFKNKKGFLESLVMDSEPSLYSILNNIKTWMSENTRETPERLQRNAEDYMDSMANHRNVKVEDGIILQYGMGTLKGTGSYDRYTPFRNNPEADFLIIMWPLGLVQASCNPFKKDRELKGVNLGEIKDEVLNKWKAQLQDRTIPLSTIKYIAESGMGAESVGFTFKDFDAIYGGKIMMMDNGEQILDSLKTIIDKPFSELSEPEMELLDKIGVNAWDLIQANSGGHKCITNISGLNYLGRAKRPPSGPYRYDPEREDAPYIKFVKMIGQEFFKVLKEKIQESKKEG